MAYFLVFQEGDTAPVKWRVFVDNLDPNIVAGVYAEFDGGSEEREIPHTISGNFIEFNHVNDAESIRVDLGTNDTQVICPQMQVDVGGDWGGAPRCDAVDGTYTLIIYKIVLPANSKVNLFEDGFGDVTTIEYNIPAPSAFAGMAFFQAVSTNGFEYQDDALAGQQTITLLPFLSGRAARSAEFWVYDTAQTIWLASAQATLEDYTTKEIIPTPGTGGTTVEQLPQ